MEGLTDARLLLLLKETEHISEVMMTISILTSIIGLNVETHPNTELFGSEHPITRSRELMKRDWHTIRTDCRHLT